VVASGQVEKKKERKKNKNFTAKKEDFVCVCDEIRFLFASAN
jgi:hypothetical protein